MTLDRVRSRRDALKCIGVLAGAAVLPGWAAGCGATSRDQRAQSWTPGLQLYTLGDAPAKDFAGVLRELTEIGFRAVELATDYGRSAQDLARAFSDAGLVCPSVHVVAQPTPGFWNLRGDVAKLAADLNMLGARYAVLSAPVLPERITKVLNDPPESGLDVVTLSRLFGSLDADDWKRTADLLNEQGAKLARSGVRIAYHNHAMEFQSRVEFANGFDFLVENTDPQLVDFELDIGWAAAAGQDLDALLEKTGKRVRLLHLKDAKQRSEHVMELASTDIGTGMVDWRKLAVHIHRLAIPHLFVEQEPPFPGPRMNSVRAAYAYLSNVFGEVR